ncbi:MAG: hypothetical protein PHF14_06685 [Verrucomicrobiota bacterium]|nr:hypothetical protein [Verrucomicrobiota bacterium]MDD8046128.1 hypothetical protein [Verrucomicrobiota bacterium]MDD8050185.1 hypothetical protein [Verrucomicrobiota bacterium]MDI9384129.1 hypothetical protein [Verrucomicrobiota bacterium]
MGRFHDLRIFDQALTEDLGLEVGPYLFREQKVRAIVKSIPLPWCSLDFIALLTQRPNMFGDRHTADPKLVAELLTGYPFTDRVTEGFQD